MGPGMTRRTWVLGTAWGRLRMRGRTVLACAALSLLGGATHCATTTSKTTPISPPVQEARSRPPEKAPAEPPFDPIPLSDEQLARACRIQPIVARASAAENLEPNLVNALVWVESKFDPSARNRSGAKGLMQLMPTTAKAMAAALKRKNRPLDPDFSVHAGAHLLRVLLDKFDGDEQLALFGYARGSGRVRAWQETRGPLPSGVREFIAKVERGRKTFARMGFPDAAARVCQKT